MSHQPLISVLMTAYNRENYIAEAIESVLLSTYNNFELIIVDDCSKDKTVAIAKAFQRKDNRIKMYVNEVNLGDYANRNKAASYATGEWIMHVDSDDRLLRNGIEDCVTAMLTYPEANFGMFSPSIPSKSYKIALVQAVRSHLLSKPFLMIGPGGTIIKRLFFNTINGYPEKYGPGNDLYFNLKACSNSDIVMLPFNFIFYRRHEGQEINNHFSYLYNNYCYFRDALIQLDLPITEKEREWLRKKNNRRFVVSLIRYLFQKRDISRTREAIKKAGFTFNDALTGIFH